MYPTFVNVHKSYFLPEFAETAGREALRVYEDGLIEDFPGADIEVIEREVSLDASPFVAPALELDLAGLDGDLNEGLTDLAKITPNIFSIVDGLCEISWIDQPDINPIPRNITINYLNSRQAVTTHRDGLGEQPTLAVVANLLGNGIFGIQDPITKIPYAIPLEPGDVVSFLNPKEYSKRPWHSAAAYKCDERISLGFQLPL